jgi:hypothetical protein
MKLSEIVRRYREEHGLSIRQFAKWLDIRLTRTKMPQADQTWGSAVGGTPRSPGGGGRKTPGNYMLFYTRQGTNRCDFM